jgi:hypothetical protein
MYMNVFQGPLFGHIMRWITLRGCLTLPHLQMESDELLTHGFFLPTLFKELHVHNSRSGN